MVQAAMLENGSGWEGTQTQGGHEEAASGWEAVEL